MSVCLPFHGLFHAVVGSNLDTSKSGQKGYASYAVQRALTDPYFYATISFQNMIVGSRYWIAQASNLSTVLSSGTAATTDFDLIDIPAYENPMLMEIRVRKSSTGTKYEPFKTFSNLISAGTTVYVSQTINNLV